MLWRTPFRTRFSRNLTLPSIVGKTLHDEPASLPNTYLLLGGFDLRATTEQEIWRRLINKELAEMPLYTLFFSSDFHQALVNSIQLTLPPSLHEKVVLADDYDGQWHDLIRPDKPERCFACIVDEDISPLTMVGPPTEEAWELFSEVAFNFWRDWES